MFTLKLYNHNGSRRIFEAESFHINEFGGRIEVTAYFPKAPDNRDNATRFDIGDPAPVQPDGGTWDYGFIENANGRTTEKLYPPAPPTSVSTHIATDCEKAA